MSIGFRNTVFVICVISCILVTALNSYSVKNDREVIHTTFNSLHAEAANAKQISVGQEYATSMARVADLEASRAHELEGALKLAIGRLTQWRKHIDQLQFQLSLDEVVLRAQSNYIEQLTKYIEENNLPVPAISFEETTEESPNKST